MDVKRTILVVDDERAIRVFLTRILDRAGYDVVAAGNGDEGLRIVQGRDALDLIIVDLEMPLMGGVEFYKRLRGLGTAVPVLVSTGFAPDLELQALVAAGTGIIEKPFSRDELLGKVTSMLVPR